MTTQRLLLLIAFFATIMVTLAAAEPSQWTVGRRESGDSLVQHEHIYRPKSTWGGVHFDKVFEGNNHGSIITQITAIGKDGTAEITSFGVGYTFVQMRFQQLEGHFIDIDIYIYGKKK